MEPSVPFSFLEYLLKTYQTSFKEIIKIIVGIIPLVDGINKNQVDGYPEIDMVTMPCFCTFYTDNILLCLATVANDRSCLYEDLVTSCSEVRPY